MMRNKLIIGLAVFAFLLFFIPKVEAESGQLYQVESEKLMVRETADPQGKIVSELYKGDLVTVFSETFGWGRTFFNGQEAWVAMHHLVRIDDENDSEEKQEKPVKKDIQEKPDETEKKTKDKQPTENDAEQEVDKKAEKKSDLARDDESNKQSKESTNGQWQKKDGAQRKLSSSINIQKKNQQKSRQAHRKPLSGYHFVIDPGHGGKDPGTKGANTLEKTLTLNTAKKVAENLNQQGATVTMTRTDDSFISLAKRVQISNAHQTDAFISLHFNSYTNTNISGLNTFYYMGGQDAQLAKKLHSSLIRHVGLVDRGARKADYYVLRSNKDLAVLIELGFLSNPEERAKVQTEAYQQQVAEGITAGLKDYFK